MTFPPGQSGNPAGRPRGSRNRRTIAEELLDGSAESLVKRAIEMAGGGDKLLLRMWIERIMPKAKQAPVAFQLPPVACAADALKALGHIVQGVGDGELPAGDATELGKLVGIVSQVARETDHELRIAKLEANTVEVAKTK